MKNNGATADQITEAQQIESDAKMKIKENSELTQNIIKQMILNKKIQVRLLKHYKK